MEELQFDDDFGPIEACCPSDAMSLNASPGLAAAEDRQSDIAQHGESSAPGIEAHACLVELSGFRIEDRAAVIVEPRLLHAFDEHEAKDWLIVPCAGAFGANWIGIIPRVEEQARQPADKHASFLGYGDEGSDLAVFVDLLPDACRS